MWIIEADTRVFKDASGRFTNGFALELFERIWGKTVIEWCDVSCGLLCRRIDRIITTCLIFYAFAEISSSLFASCCIGFASSIRSLTCPKCFLLPILLGGYGGGDRFRRRGIPSTWRWSKLWFKGQWWLFFQLQRLSRHWCRRSITVDHTLRSLK